MYRFLIVGKESVGKTSLIHSFCGQKFQEEYIPTVEYQWTKLGPQMEICDTPGKEIFFTGREHLKNFFAVILLFDKTRKSSFGYYLFIKKDSEI